MDDRVDVKDLTFGDLLTFAKRLKISSIVWIVSTAIVLISGAYGAGVASKYFGNATALQEGGADRELLDSSRFENAFAARFVDRDIITPLISAILEESPDGVDTETNAMLSLLWQLKSQDGYAQFLSGNDYISVQITQTDDGFDLEWDEGTNLIPKILDDLSIPSDPNIIRQHNAELNLIGVAWLSDTQHIVRDIDGGLLVATGE